MAANPTLMAEAKARIGLARKEITAIESEIRRMTAATTRTASSLTGEGIREKYIRMALAARKYTEASGALAVATAGKEGARASGERAAAAQLQVMNRRFLTSIPSRLPERLKAELTSASAGYQVALGRLAAFSASASPATSAAATQKTKAITHALKMRQKRLIAPSQLRYRKPRIVLQPRAVLPPPAHLRLLGKRIALRHPRPAAMTEATYSDFILGMTRRAAVQSANATAAGAQPEAALQAGVDATVADAPAVLEEVTTNVSAPAGEEVADATIQSAADEILQGAAETGSLPSVAPVPAAAASAPTTTFPSESTEQQAVSTLPETFSPVPEPASIPFYRRPLVVGGVAAGLLLLYGWSQYQPQPEPESIT